MGSPTSIMSKQELSAVAWRWVIVLGVVLITTPIWCAAYKPREILVKFKISPQLGQTVHEERYSVRAYSVAVDDVASALKRMSTRQG